MLTVEHSKKNENSLRNRYGRAGAALAIALFLVSCLVLLPLAQWYNRSVDCREGIDEYVFKSESQSSEAAARIEIKQWHYLETFSEPIAQFQTVFWESKDTESLRSWIDSSGKIADADILEIGTGTGLVALCCLKQHAASVVATDINPAAVANAKYNAENLGFSSRLDVRRVTTVDPGPFAVIDPDQQFDLIISNPPWENHPVEEVAAYALYDPGFSLLDAILEQSAEHLNDGGSLLLAYGAKAAVQRILTKAPEHGWTVNVLDDRNVTELPDVFLPGMLIELRR